ncbi:MAG: ATP-binding protein [Candidatus Marinimicrobia bacterium]|nr:ATP-binding protein [Candidatus Neomarinimicrobiota bacterium]
MIERKATETILRLSKGFPVVAITGPRQSGKTTLARAVFPDKSYVSLEDPDSLAFAETDPRSFLRRYPDGAILDEVQRCPDLFSYIQGIVDEDKSMGKFILTGSQQFGLHTRITQSLAGRVGLVQLLPFSYTELAAGGKPQADLESVIYSGAYPPVHDRNILPEDWYPGYVATYVERALRQLVNVRDLSMFQLFLRMCAARTGQLLNLSSLANDCGITHNTAKAWLSVLEASYILFLLQPHHRNFNKRLIKSPKLYFYDTGLVAWLLGIQDGDQIMTHSMRGALFETWVVAELIKGRCNRGLRSNLFFWRDSSGNEVDVLAEQGEQLVPVEIKAGRTISVDYFSALNKWSSLAGVVAGPASLVYAGDDYQKRKAATVIPWQDISLLAETL